jgi:hypothetical protein
LFWHLGAVASGALLTIRPNPVAECIGREV